MRPRNSSKCGTCCSVPTGIPGRPTQWPELAEFNWVRDYFDVIASGNDAPALRVVDDTKADQAVTFREMAQRSGQSPGSWPLAASSAATGC